MDDPDGPAVNGIYSFLGGGGDLPLEWRAEGAGEILEAEESRYICAWSPAENAAEKQG